MNKLDFPVSGSCQCGKVRYQLLEPPLKVIACHCKECQTLSTSAFSITTMVKAGSMVFKGEMKEWERSSDSGNRNVAKFCPDCGNRIYHFNPDQPEILKLKGRLDNSGSVQPTAHVWLAEKQDWYEVPNGVEKFETQP